MIYSIAATACASVLKVEDYLTRLLTADNNTTLLPWGYLAVTNLPMKYYVYDMQTKSGSLAGA